MNPTMARLVAVFSALLLMATVATLWITSQPASGGETVRAEFEDVYPLLPGMHVRVDGAIAGEVGSIDVGTNGKAVVTLELFEGTSPPRADASAAIRQQDITGDSYVALAPGSDSAPLGETTIPTSRTIVAPRFDDLLGTFDEPVRQGLELVLIEVGKGLEGRGADLNTAILALRPGLEAANQALAEVRSQNAALRSLIVDAEAVTGQAASRSQELGVLVESLDTALTTMAEHGGSLDAALAKLPATTEEARVVLARLARFAGNARPLAETLAASAPDLEVTLQRLGPFLDDADATLASVGPTLSLVDNLLTKSLPTLRTAPDRVLTAPLDIAAAAGAVLDALLGERDLQRALFSADGYGSGAAAEDDFGLGAIAAEEGDQFGYEGMDPERRFLRAHTVLTCETFGFEIRPGCLEAAIAAMSRQGGRGDGNGDGGGGAGSDNGGSAPGGDGTGQPQQPGPADDGGGEDPLGDTLDDVEGDVDDLLDDIGGAIGGNGGGGGGGGQPGDLGPAEDLLDLLTGP